MYNKIRSKLMCLGFTWGIFSWISFYKNSGRSPFFYSIPVFLSIKISNLLMKCIRLSYNKNIFLFTVLLCGFMGYSISLLFLNTNKAK